MLTRSRNELCPITDDDNHPKFDEDINQECNKALHYRIFVLGPFTYVE